MQSSKTKRDLSSETILVMTGISIYVGTIAIELRSCKIHSRNELKKNSKSSVLEALD